MILVILLWFTAWALTRVITDATAQKAIVLVSWILAVVIVLFNGGYLRTH